MSFLICVENGSPTMTRKIHVQIVMVEERVVAGANLDVPGRHWGEKDKDTILSIGESALHVGPAGAPGKDSDTESC